jgi:hypothetical protein
MIIMLIDRGTTIGRCPKRPLLKPHLRVREQIVTAGMLRRSFLIVAAVTVLSWGPLWAQSHDAVEKATKDTLRQLDLQLELPRGVEPFRVNLRLPQEVVWVALVCAAALILYSFRDLIPLWHRQATDAWDTEAEASGGALLEQTPQALQAADELGREGRFVEAMHMLLIQSLADIRRYLGEQFADSLTSREILRGVRLPVAGRASLHDIVSGVELTYFGGRPATAADYTACRHSFETLRQALRGGAPA